MPDKALAERLERYRRNAAAAERQAERATDPVSRRSLRKLADGWAVLADQIEAQIALAALRAEQRAERTAKPN